MDIETEESFLQKCRVLIEERLGWGSSEAWATNDYELLSQKIQEVTNVNLSVATLKRIWGKVRYDSKPTPTTLNTLAQYLGFENWRAFTHQQHSNGNGRAHIKNGHDQDYQDKEQDHDLPELSSNSLQKRPYFWVAVLIFMLALASLIFYRTTKVKSVSAKLDSTRFQFSSRKVVDEGLPNTVIFDYDASAASPADSVFIQQSWDKRLRKQVARDQKQHASIYYYPGFFEAKLVVTSRVMKEHPVFIRTSGWLPLVDQKPVPVYFKESEARHDGVMNLSLEKLREYNIPLQPTTPWVAYYNVRDFGDLKTDDIIFETEFKNDYKEGSAACQHTEVHLLFEGGALVIPFSVSGCVSELQFMNKDGKKSDLSKLGCDFSKWVKLSIEFKGKEGKIFINGTKSFEFMIGQPPKKVVGMAFRFQGTGSVNAVKLAKTGGEVVWEEMF